MGVVVEGGGSRPLGSSRTGVAEVGLPSLRSGRESLGGGGIGSETLESLPRRSSSFIFPRNKGSFRPGGDS